MNKVWFYVPNIIDYIRIIFMILSFHYFYKEINTTLFFYILSCLMDMMDGFLARKLNQQSIFGGVLDMVTDRMTTIGFLTFLSNLYKEYVFFFGVIIYLDILSHWMLMMATFQNNSQNHKQQHFKSWILTQFYKNRFTLTLLCFGNEAFLVQLYIQGFSKNQWVLTHNPQVMCFFFPLFLAKQIVHFAQLKYAAYNLILLDKTSYINN